MKSVLFIILVLSLGVTVKAQPKVHYTLSMTHPSSHYLEVRISVSDLDATDGTLELAMGAWRTGRYVILDFAGGVSDFKAMDPDGNELSWKKTDKQTWEISKGERTGVEVSYLVYANEFNLRTRGLDDQHAFVDPVAVFMYLRKRNDTPLMLSIRPFGDWHVTTGMEQVEGETFTYSAPTFEYFADCPIEIGNQKEYEFEHEGKDHVWMIAGEAEYDIDKIIDDTKKIISENLKFWGRIPYERFVFMLHVSPGSGGGTEHLNSTVLGTRPTTFSNERAYKGFLGLISHEYFHTWNVKQLRPAAITPYDFSKENYSEELWLAEGGTSFFDELILLRAGLSTADEYFRGLARDIEEDRERPGNKKQSVTQASFDAWIMYWKRGENSYNTESDYYGKGKLATLLLSLEVLKRSKGKASMQDVMKEMFLRFPVFQKGYTVEDLRAVCERFAGGSMEEFFGDYIYGAQDYPWEDALAVVGLKVESSQGDSKATLGVWSGDATNGVRVRGVVEHSAAFDAGLSVGDVIVALDGYQVSSSELSARVGELKPGDRMSLTVFRNKMLRSIDVVLGEDPIPSYTVTRVEDPSDEQIQSYERLFGVAWPE